MKLRAHYTRDHRQCFVLFLFSPIPHFAHTNTCPSHAVRYTLDTPLVLTAESAFLLPTSVITYTGGLLITVSRASSSLRTVKLNAALCTLRAHDAKFFPRSAQT